MNVTPPAFILIPYQLLADERVKPLEEKLYGFIYWMTRLKNEKCTASNDTFAQLLKTTPAVVRNSLTNLERRGYIRRTFKDRNKRVRDEITPLIDFNNVAQDNSPAPERVKREVAKVEVTDGIGREVNDLIKLFEPVNPSYERLFAIIPQRRALERMMKKHGKTKTEGAIKAAIGVYGKTHAPVITTPLQLEHKLGQLVAYWQRENKRGPQLVEI